MNHVKFLCTLTVIIVCVALLTLLIGYSLLWWEHPVLALILTTIAAIAGVAYLYHRAKIFEVYEEEDKKDE